MSLFKICQIDTTYIDYLRTFDAEVRMNSNGRRKYVGIVLEINNKTYYAPMSSPKPKYFLKKSDALDIHKIQEGNLGVINLNNMIPVPPEAIIDININEETNIKYKRLLQTQYKLLKADYSTILRKAKALHKIVTSPEENPLKSFCCKFNVLETKCEEYTSALPPII